MDKYISLAKHYEQYDMPYQAIPKDELIKIEPALESIVDELCGGIYYPDDEGGNAYKFTCEMAKIAEEIGVRFTYNVSVEKLRG